MLTKNIDLDISNHGSNKIKSRKLAMINEKHCGCLSSP